MKKQNYFLFAVSVGILIFAIVVGVALFNDSSSETVAPAKKQEQTANQEPAKPLTIPQLSEERADAATMVLISAPPLQPLDHTGRWNPELLHQSCLTCHEMAATGAKEIPIDHYTDEDRSKGIFGPRAVCITCHGEESGDTKPGFNRDN